MSLFSTGKQDMGMVKPRMEEQRNTITATTAMRVAAELRQLILTGVLKPDQRLKIDELSTMFNVSHMPVREALQELESEGILVVYPHRGTVIRGMDDRFIRNMYDVRGAIEGMLTERCTKNIRENELLPLRLAATEYEEAVARNDHHTATQANFQFHGIINSVANNPEAVRVLTQGKLLIEALRYRFGSHEWRLIAVVKEHRNLVAAIASGKAKRAGEIAKMHCIGARDDILALFAESKPEAKNI